MDGRTDIFGLGATMYYLISGVKYSLPLWKSRVPGCPEYLNRIIHTCVQKEPKQRYQSSKMLYREITKQRKRCARSRLRCKVWAALLLLILTAGIAVRELPAEFAIHREESWNYEKLLEEALCVPWDKSLEYYQQALFLEPARKEAYLQYLDAADNDGIFSQKEEEAFRVMIHTIPLGQAVTYEEILAGNNRTYGEVAYRIGIVYWFYYKSSDGKRIAGGWLAKSKKILEKLPGDREKEDWENGAEIFAHMSTYYEQLGKEYEPGEGENPAVKYWEDFVQILKLKEEGVLQDSIELQFLNEAMGQLIFLAEELYQSGVTVAELKENVEYVITRTTKVGTETGDREATEKWKKEILEQAETVMAVIENMENAELEK